MFTTGSKLLIGSAAAAAVFALVYGITQEGALGTIGLISAAIALSLLAGINVFVRDSNVFVTDEASFESSAAARATARPSLTPMLVAVGATALTLGLVTYEAVFVLGLIVLIAGAAEWLVQGWSEGASADEAYNEQTRHTLFDPLEVPVAAAAGGAVIVYAFSRIMLGLPSKTATVVAFAVVATLVLVVGGVLGARHAVSRTTMLGSFSVAGVALIALGAFFGLNGERETEEHPTTGDIAEDDGCGPDETEADERASQSVAAKSSLAAEVIFDGTDLHAEFGNYEGPSAVLTLPRSNPNNILFRNDGDDHARLVIELHPDIEDGVPLGPERLCTALTDEGGSQLLTVVFDRPTFAVDGGYAFTVPGTDAALEVVVP